MAQNLYDVEKTAQVLGVSGEEVLAMRERNELRGFKVGPAWKFKAEQVDELAQRRRSGSGVLESGESLGSSDLGISPSSGGKPKSGSDVVLSGPQSVGDQFDDVDMAIDNSGIKLADSGVKLSDSGAGKPAAKEPVAKKPSGSSIDLGDYEDMVLSGSGSGSDVTIGADSGIMLVDPADSGLSLEEPVNLAGSHAESFEFGEDDMITLAEEPANLDAPTMLKRQDDFDLQPSRPTEEDDESGSQVIALDTEGMGGESLGATLAAAAGRPPMLDEEAAPVPLGGAVSGIGAARMAPGPGIAPAPVTVETIVETLPEAPYSATDILLLVPCVVLLPLGGMLIFDVLRNIWSWEGTYSINSSLMNIFVKLIEG